MPSFLTSPEGALGTLCAQGRPYPLEPLGTAISVLFRLFRLFPAFRRIQAALPYPSDHFSPERRKASESLLYGFSTQDGHLAILAILAKAPTPGRLN